MLCAAIVAGCLGHAVQAQTATLFEPAEMACPNVLGQGVRTELTFCDVVIGDDPEAGIIITIPPHTGPVTLMFDLHNRHLYSEELIKAKTAYRRYTAGIGVLTMDNWLVSRAAVRSEFRSAADLVDRIAADAGGEGVKPIAPTGSELISLTIPEGHQRVSILGEKLTVVRPEGVDEFSVPGRPVAVISNVTLAYRPGPTRRR